MPAQGKFWRMCQKSNDSAVVNGGSSNYSMNGLCCVGGWELIYDLAANFWLERVSFTDNQNKHDDLKYFHIF